MEATSMADDSSWEHEVRESLSDLEQRHALRALDGATS